MEFLERRPETYMTAKRAMMLKPTGAIEADFGELTAAAPETNWLTDVGRRDMTAYSPIMMPFNAATLYSPH